MAWQPPGSPPQQPQQPWQPPSGPPPQAWQPPAAPPQPQGGQWQPPAGQPQQVPQAPQQPWQSPVAPPQAPGGAQVSNSHIFIQRAIKAREDQRSGKSRTMAILWGLGLAIVGIVMIAVLFPGHPGDTSAPSCNGHTMSPGDICEITVNDHSQDYTYAQMILRQQASHPAWLVVGIILLILAIVFFIGACTTYSPSKPWGKPVQGYCPRCSQPSLREAVMKYSVTRGRTKTTWSANITLCTPQCGYASARQLSAARLHHYMDIGVSLG